MPSPPFTPHIAALPSVFPFTGPEAMERQRGRPFRARLGANENPFGPSPRARAAMEAAVSDIWMYADPESHELRQSIATHHGVSINGVVIGEGIDGLLGLTCMMFLRPGDVVISSDGAYPTFNAHVALHQGAMHLVAIRDGHEDLDQLVGEANSRKARLLYVSNPNSPLGSFWSRDAIREAIENVHDDCIVVLDEAYVDLAPAAAVLPMDTSAGKVLRFRTFSKAYALAGARIGYAVGAPDVIAGFEKVRNHYGINLVGQKGAQAALEDQQHLAATTMRINAACRRIADIAADNGLGALSTAASFVAIDCGQDAGFARAVLDALLCRDVFVRKPTAPGIDHLIRVSAGDEAALDWFADQFPKALQDARRHAR